MRTRNIFDPAAADPFPLSRSKLALFLECPRCFYLDRRLGVGRIDSPPYTLNLAVDALLKREFDLHRLARTPHPVMALFGLDVLPCQDRRLDEWRDNRKGVSTDTAGFHVFGAVDDLWVDGAGNVSVVDYKATSTDASPTLDHPSRDGYKRQAEVYQWLLRRNGLCVSDTAYFLFCNARKDGDRFDAHLTFDLSIIPYLGSDAWVEDALHAAQECLMHDTPPPYTETCQWCRYRRDAQKF